MWSRLFRVVQAIPRGPGYSVWSRLFHEVHGAEATTSPGSLIEMWTLSPNPDFWIKACIFTGSPSDSHWHLRSTDGDSPSQPYVRFSWVVLKILGAHLALPDQLHQNLWGHQQTIGLRKWGTYIQWNITQPWKDWNTTIFSNVDGPRDYQTKWSKSDSEVNKTMK